MPVGTFEHDPLFKSDKLLIQACRTADKFVLLLWFSRAYEQVAKERPDKFRLKGSGTEENLSTLGHCGEHSDEKKHDPRVAVSRSTFLDPQSPFYLR